MTNKTKAVSTCINISGKEVELNLNERAIRIFIENVEDLDSSIGFTLNEFAHLVYAAAITTAEENKRTLEINFLDVYNALRLLKKTEAGQREIERIAKSFKQAEAYDALLELIISRNDQNK
jgi:hypothetical protein